MLRARAMKALAAERAAHQAPVDEHARTVEAHKAAVAAFEKDKARHVARLDELERVRQSLAA